LDDFVANWHSNVFMHIFESGRAAIPESAGGGHMRPISKSLLSMFILTAFALVASIPVMQAATVDLGGIRLYLPHVHSHRRSGTYNSGINAHPRWYVAMQDGRSFATNNQGFWIGHDERGELVMQFQLAVPSTATLNSPVPIQFDVNGRYFDTVQGVLATPNLAVVHSADVERVIGRLMSGSRVAVTYSGNRIETHLRGSSDAIESVRRGAALQRTTFLQDQSTAKTEVPADDSSIVQYFLPGVKNNGTVEVRFDIVEGRGLVLYLNFSAIEGHGDPAYSMPLTKTEARRVIAMTAKATEWTEIARANRVALFSKRIGYVDDANGAPLPQPTDEGDGTGPASPEKPAAATGSITTNTLPAPSPKTAVAKADPLDFKAMTFNSYEDGTTSVQIEHSVQGFSRRFNMDMVEAQDLASTLESTLQYATFRLENRETNPDVKDELFR
jgi:hypothetical protein